MPDFESPITKTYPVVADAAVALADESSTTKTLVRSDHAQFGLSFGSSVRIGDALVCASRPDEWLLLGSESAVAAAAHDIDTGGFASVIPFTHGRAMFRLTGEPVDSLLEKVCGLDWSDAMTPDGAVVSASVALTTCDIVRDDDDGTPSYLLICDRSFGQYLFDALIDAGDEFGITVPTP